jgi:hypothetical protein
MYKSFCIGMNVLREMFILQICEVFFYCSGVATMYSLIVPKSFHTSAAS